MEEEKTSAPLEESVEARDPSLSSPLKQIRTFQGDVANALKNQNESLVSIQRAEVSRNMERAENRPLTEEEKAHKRSITSGILLAFGIILLIGLGGAGSWYAYRSYKTKTAVPETVVVPNMFFHTDTVLHNNALSISRESMILAIQIEKQNTTGPLIEQFQLHTGEGPTAPLLSTEGFLSLMMSHAPNTLVRAFNPLFMLGTIGTNPRHTFLLIKLDSYENAFPGMLAWEESLADDLLPLFASQPVVESLPPQTPFVDTTIQNKDARVLKDPSTGQTILLYSFFDNSVLIITDSEETLRSIVTRLNSEKLTR